MASDTKGPGLLYVNSKITSSKLSPELFTAWYQDVHIPDILATSGVKTAYRYFTTSDEETVDRPYLALYPLEDVAFLQTSEFESIPVHSDLVPTDSKCIFDLADFHVCHYINVGKVEADQSKNEPGPYIASVLLDPPSVVERSGAKAIKKWYFSQHSPDAMRVRLYSLLLGRHSRAHPEENQLADPPGLLALHEFENELELQRFTKSARLGATVASFELVKAFGAIQHNF